MKHLLFSLILLPTWLYGQTYVPFVSTTDSSDTWMDVLSCSDFNCYDAYTNRYTINGDTTIGAFQYAKVYRKRKHQHGQALSQSCSEYITYYDSYYGAIRESGKQLFVIPNFNPVEYIAYDFNLTIGDTLPSPDGFLGADPTDRIITAIDSVLVFGIYRKRYVVNTEIYVIEGIGASTGLFNQIVNNFACYKYMQCYAEYGTPDYFLVDCNMNLNINAITQEDTPTLLKIVDCMGRETEPVPNTPLIYVYSNGVTKKVFNLEP